MESPWSQSSSTDELSEPAVESPWSESSSTDELSSSTDELSDDQGGSSSDFYVSPEASPSQPRKRANTRTVTPPSTAFDEDIATQIHLDEAVANAASDEDPAADAWAASVLHDGYNNKEPCSPRGSH